MIMNNGRFILVCLFLFIGAVASEVYAQGHSNEGTTKGLIISGVKVNIKDDFSGITDAGPWTKQRSGSKATVAVIPLGGSEIADAQLLSKTTNIIFNFLSKQKQILLAPQETVNKNLRQNGISFPPKSTEREKTVNLVLSTYDITVFTAISEGWLQIVSYRATSRTQALYHGLSVYLGTSSSIQDLDTTVTPALSEVLKSIDRVLVANPKELSKE
jgi:hypothetical protein